MDRIRADSTRKVGSGDEYKRRQRMKTSRTEHQQYERSPSHLDWLLEVVIGCKRGQRKNTSRAQARADSKGKVACGPTVGDDECVQATAEGEEQQFIVGHNRLSEVTTEQK